MGVGTPSQPRPFTPADVHNRDLVLAMLRYEDSLFLGPRGQHLFKDASFEHLSNLETYYTFHRATLAKYGFQTTDKDVEMYRTIFRTYYNSPTEYDAEVLNAVCYMRENKCVYYKDPTPSVGDPAPDVALATLEGAPTTLHATLASLPHKYVFVGAFSNS